MSFDGAPPVDDVRSRIERDPLPEQAVPAASPFAPARPEPSSGASGFRTDGEQLCSVVPRSSKPELADAKTAGPNPTLDLASAARETWDVLVIGAGPAGALAARQAALAGARVLLVERKTFPRWKVCGACVNEQALSVLRGVGLGDLTTSLGAIPLDEFRLRAAGREARLRLPGGVSVSRARFDAALARTAIDAGCAFLSGTQAQVEAVEEGHRSVALRQRDESATAAARVVLAAAGLGHDCLPAAQGLQSVAENSRIGAGATLTEFPEYYERGTIFMAVGRGGYVGLVRPEDDTLNVAAAFDRTLLSRTGGPGSGAASLLEDAGFPRIDSLATAHWQGTVSLTRHPPQPAHERLFMLGDASGYVEPFTGEGIAWALAAAVAVVPLAARGAVEWNSRLPAQWTDLCRRTIGRRQRLCRLLATLLRSPLCVRAAIRMLSLFPGLATPLVARLNSSVVSSGGCDS